MLVHNQIVENTNRGKKSLKQPGERHETQNMTVTLWLETRPCRPQWAFLVTLSNE